MNRPIIILILLGLFSCKDGRINEYESLVNKADRIVISDQKHKDSIVFATLPLLNNMKDILKRNINPVSSRKFLADWSIALYNDGQKTGVLLISSAEKPYVNFRSEGLNMTFPLTYGIGMSVVDSFSPDNSR